MSAPPPVPTASVTGTALYRERIVLPPGAELEVVLEDVSLSDVAADPVVIVRQPDVGQPPYAFELVYDPRRIVPSRDYAVRARLTLGGRLLFTTDTVCPVITHGNLTTVELLLTRVAGAAGRATGGKPGDLDATLPATFTGLLPCADCGGIEYHLDFFQEGSFFVRTTHPGKPDGTSDDIGRYALATDGIMLALQGGRAAPLYFSIEDADRLRKLDLDGGPIESQLNYDLVRTEDFSPIEPALARRGLFSYLADAAAFAECLTGRTMPMEGPGPVPTLVVDRFLRLAPGEECPPRFDNSPLTDTYWKLVALGGEPVAPVEGQPEAHFVLRTGQGRLAGSDGCNRIVGGYALDGEGIRFSQMASTMMACPQGMDTASRYAAALEAAVRWRIVGWRPELYDAAGVLVARLEARQ